MPGKIVHFEVPASDTDRARTFYSGVFGWEFGESAMPDMDYRMVRTSEEQGGAVYASDELVGKGLRIYFDTDDIDASIAKVRDGGGHADDKQPIPHVGWFSHCRDLDGNEFSLFQSDESVQMPQ